ncbi:MAG: surface lipoprotein assembly modifier [Gammaproteobacteria bacterium]|nr:surface lipoprotein assembly modifier [Gammaproteobacteria bacterium]
MITILVITVFLVFHAPPSIAADTPDSFQIPAVEAAKVLLHARKWNEAREILEGLKLGDEEEEIERLFLLGIAESRLEMHGSAAQRFEAILARQPNLTRVRLELARAYHALGRDGKARFHFRASLADRLPTSVQDAVESWLDHIDARKRWSASLSVSVLPESNPAKRTDSREVRIGGVPFQLDEDSRAASGTGLLISTGVQYSPVIGGDLRGVVAGSAAGKFFRNYDWNDISVQGDFGIARLFDRGNVSGGIRYSQRWLGGERYSLGLGPWLRGRNGLSPRTETDFSLSAEHLEHTSQVGMDGWILRLRTGLDYAFSAGTSSRLEIDLVENDAREQRHGHRIVGLALSLSHAFEGGFSVSPRISFQRRHHVAANPLFQKIRSDRLVQLSVNLLHRAFQYRGFTPYLGYSYEVNRSNIPVNEYSNHGAVLGVSRSF